MKILQEQQDITPKGGACPVSVLEHKYTSLSASRPSPLVIEQDRSTKSKYRGQRWELREGLREITTLKRLRECGKVPVAPLVTLRGEQGETAGYGGLSTCSSVWACSVCSAKVAHARQEEVAQLVAWAEKEGYRVSMVTFTQSHKKESLGFLWDSLKSGWKALVSGSRWAQFKEQTGLVGYVKATEITHGLNSWHAHYHAILLHTAENIKEKALVFKNGEIMSCEDFLFSRWQKGLKKAGVTCSRERGIDIRTAKEGDAETLGRYVAKMGTVGMANEVTLSAFKQAKNGNRTPFQIAQDAVAGDEESRRLWWEFERISKGRRALIFSDGLRDLAQLGEERTDQDIAEEEVGGDVVLTLDKANWYKVRKHGAYNLLEALEKGGIYTARRWCDERGIVWKPPEVGKYREPKRE